MEQRQHKKIMNGTVESAADFTRIGVYIDVNKNDSGVTDVKYTISGEIAIVSFRYKGVRRTEGILQIQSV